MGHSPVTTARTVPVTVEMDGDELDAEDAWRMARKHGVLRLGIDSFVRFSERLRENLAATLNEVAVRGQTIYVTNHGRRVAAIVPVPVAEQIDQLPG